METKRRKAADRRAVADKGGAGTATLEVGSATTTSSGGLVLTGPLASLGGRIRAARRERGMSQENLAQPEFTKSYVSAVERGKARPSLKALDLMSRRLNLSMQELLRVQPADGDPDPEAMEAELGYALDNAEMLLSRREAGTALERQQAAAKQYGNYIEGFGAATRYRLSLLRAQAQLRQGAATEARQELNGAMQILQTMEGNAEETERVRNLVGEAYYAQEMPRLALEEHEACLRAVRDGIVQDPQLRLSILNNLARDYWALDDADHAMALHKEAQKVINETSSLDRQTAAYWELSRTYGATGDKAAARRYAGKALATAEIAQNLITAAEMNVRFAEILTSQQKYAEAEKLLTSARTLLQQTGNREILSSVAERHAALEMERNNLDAAAGYANEAVSLSETGKQSSDTDKQARAQARRTAIRALRIAGLVAERQGRAADADQMFERALTLTNEADARDLVSDLERTYADLLVARGSHEQAASHYRAAFKHQQRR